MSRDTAARPFGIRSTSYAMYPPLETSEEIVVRLLRNGRKIEQHLIYYVLYREDDYRRVEGVFNTKQFRQLLINGVVGRQGWDTWFRLLPRR